MSWMGESPGMWWEKLRCSFEERMRQPFGVALDGLPFVGMTNGAGLIAMRRLGIEGWPTFPSEEAVLQYLRYIPADARVMDLAKLRAWAGPREFSRLWPTPDSEQRPGIIGSRWRFDKELVGAFIEGLPDQLCLAGFDGSGVLFLAGPGWRVVLHRMIDGPGGGPAFDVDAWT